MNKIEINHPKNRLVILLNGFHCANKELFITDIEQAATTLPHGFSCIIILSKDTTVSDKELQALEDLLYAYGLRTVVYVGGHHCSSFRHKGFSSLEDMTIRQANTREEAEAVLSAPAVHSFETADIGDVTSRNRGVKMYHP